MPAIIMTVRRIWSVGFVDLGVDYLSVEPFYVGMQYPNPGHHHPLAHDNFSLWAIGDNPLWLDYSNPTILYLDNKTFNPDYVVIPEDCPEGSWIYLVIKSSFPKSNRTQIPAAHPVSQPEAVAVQSRSGSGLLITKTGLDPSPWS